jgi:hypothetical protein
MDSHDPSGIVCDTTCDMCLKDSIYNNSNGAMTLTFEYMNAPSTQPLIVKLVEFNCEYYISIAGHIMPLNEFYTFKSAQETPYGLSVCVGNDKYITYKRMTTTQFMTIMSAVGDAVVDSNIPIGTPSSPTALQPDEECDEEPHILDTLIAPPNPDTLHSPNSTPLTKTDQIAFLIGIIACLITPLYSVYLALSTIKFA